MKTISVRKLQEKIRKCVEASQKEHVVVTRHGQPAAILIGVLGYDWEDVFWATSAAFWKTIQERRNEKGIPWAEAVKRLEARWRRSRARHG